MLSYPSVNLMDSAGLINLLQKQNRQEKWGRAKATDGSRGGRRKRQQTTLGRQRLLGNQRGREKRRTTIWGMGGNGDGAKDTWRQHHSIEREECMQLLWSRGGRLAKVESLRGDQGWSGGDTSWMHNVLLLFRLYNICTRLTIQFGSVYCITGYFRPS